MIEWIKIMSKEENDTESSSREEIDSGSSSVNSFFAVSYFDPYALVIA